MLKIIVSLVIMTISTSCAFRQLNVDHHIPTTMGLIPESSGHLLGGSLELINAHTDHRINLVRSTQTSLFGSVSNTEVNTTKSLEASGGMGIKGTLGLFKRLDYVLKTASEAPTMHGVRFQLIGDSFKERKKGFKLAVAALYGQGKDTEEGRLTISIEDEGTNSFDNVTGEVLMKQREAAVILGYRFTDFFLLFGTANYIHVDSKASLTVNSKPTYVLADSEYFGGTIGGRIHSTFSAFNFFSQIEVGRSRGHILKGPHQTIDAFDFSIGFAW